MNYVSVVFERWYVYGLCLIGKLINYLEKEVYFDNKFDSFFIMLKVLEELYLMLVMIYFLGFYYFYYL